MDNRTLVLLELLVFFPIFIQRILEFNTLSFPLNSLYGFLRDLALQFSIRNTRYVNSWKMGSILAESHNFIETLRKNNDKKKYITLENSLNNQSTDVLMYWGEFILLIITCIYLKINDIHVISHDKQYLSCIEIITRNFFLHVFSGFSDNNSELLMENPIYKPCTLCDI